MTVLHNQCPSESPTGDLPISHSNRVVFHSPRYGCINPRNKQLNYRKSEFCLYNISIPECWVNATTIQPSQNIQSLQERDDNGVCRDYVQFFWGSSFSPRYCGSELSVEENFNLTVPSLQFLAVLWTDSASSEENGPGFDLTASCPTDSTAREWTDHVFFTALNHRTPCCKKCTLFLCHSLYKHVCICIFFHQNIKIFH